jgi:hypothetical protein
MKMAEILRQLADKLDSMENITSPAVAEPEQEVAVQPAMMSPLQQKIELLKKGVGVESQFDSDEDTELNVMKRNAGISPAVVHVASDDEPVE